ncbi:MAG: SDR family oxidoreductase [Deltaproteobacteria bacterium]|nr:SDR family oxidoreductase [Deltaproteobacteria bacterium]
MPGSARWTAADLPDLSGRVFVVTGGNSGIGLETARELARKGGHVVIGCRDEARAVHAMGEIRASAPHAAVESLPLDLADLASVRTFAETLGKRHARLDVLCNNAGVMALPYRKTTDGFEMQIGTNHLGHFALTGLLLRLLLATPGARVVTIASGAHRYGRICFDDLQSERRYGKWRAYAQSKLANLLFGFELARRMDAARADLVSVAAHPGYAATNLPSAGPRMSGSWLGERAVALGNRLLAQSPAMGALPSLYAIAAPDVRSGEYYGPDGLREMRGHPRRVAAARRARDPETAERLWQISEALTGVRW